VTETQSKHDPSDPRQRLIAAMMRLYPDRDQERLTVTKLSDTAGVSRRTFYRYFESVDDLRDRGIDTLFLQLRERSMAQRGTDSLDATRDTISAILELVNSERRFFAALLRHDQAGPAVSRLFDLAVALSQSKATAAARTRDVDRYLACGVILGALYYTVDHDLKPSEITTLTDEVVTAIRSGLRLPVSVAGRPPIIGQINLP
jgi:AcrR family transcriptional regulator